MDNISIGIDISKAHLDVACHPKRQSCQFNNTPDGIKTLIAWLDGQPGLGIIVFEPTGRYHKALERALITHQFPFAKINGYQIKRFAQGIGRRAKTDAIDAETLALYGAMVQPKPDQMAGMLHQGIEPLKEILTAHRALIKDRTATKNRLAAATIPMVQNQLQQTLEHIATQITALEQEMSKRIKAEPALQRGYDILCSIPGIGPITAVTLLVEMPELGTTGKKQIAALAGLAPITQQSGQWQGKAHIAGGRAPVRHALFMPALVAIRYNTWLKQTYDRLTQAGKPKKVAIIAVMRKLITLANALIKDDRKWAENNA